MFLCGYWWFWWFLVVLGGSWLFLLVHEGSCCSWQSLGDLTSAVVGVFWCFLVVLDGSCWFLVVPDSHCRWWVVPGSIGCFLAICFFFLLVVLYSALWLLLGIFCSWWLLVVWSCFWGDLSFFLESWWFRKLKISMTLGAYSVERIIIYTTLFGLNVYLGWSNCIGHHWHHWHHWLHHKEAQTKLPWTTKNKQEETITIQNNQDIPSTTKSHPKPPRTN